MALKKSEKIWMNGNLINWDDAKIHVLSHVIHYGSSIFEGLRCYETKKGSCIFRLPEHMERLIKSGKIYRMKVPFSVKELCDGVIDTIKINNLKSCYIRPISYRGYKELGVNPFNCPVDTAIAVWEWGKYLGEDGVENGIDVCVSTWNRLAPNTMPAMAKAGANYMNSQLIKMEALLNGYAEGIGLNRNGYVCEGSGENIFLLMNGKIITPPLAMAGLPGITRASVITIIKDFLNLEVSEQPISREMLYLADELFLTGTAAEVTPVRSVDKIDVGKGKRGKITKKIQETFFAIVNGEIEDKYNWLTYV